MAWLVGSLAAALVATAPAATPPLALVHREPLVVRGTHFKAHERVAVRVNAVRVVVRTSALGRFFTTLGVDRCTGGRVVATGAAGEHAVLRLPPVECAPP